MFNFYLLESFVGWSYKAILFLQHLSFLVALLGEDCNFRVEVCAGGIAKEGVDNRKDQIGLSLS